MNTFDHKSGDHLEFDGASIYYEITGNPDGPPLLLLHGGFGNIENFNPILPRLEKEFKIIGIDSRGHGKSTLGEGPLTYGRIQRDVEHILDHLNVDNLSIMGFSDGGIVAYRLASFSAMNVQRLVTIGSRWHFKNAERTEDIFRRITSESWKTRFPDTYDSYQDLNPRPDFDHLVKSVVDMWLDPASSGYPNEAVSSIDCTLLIVRGDDDHLISREAVVELAGTVKHAKLLNFPFAGHAAFLEQTELFMITLNTFFKS